MKIFFITGKPACGKDTQADFIAKKFKAKKIITGAVIDNFFAKTRGKYALINGVKFNVEKQKKFKISGKLVAYRLVVYLLSQRIIEAIKNKESLVFSGSPRSYLEARQYLKIFKKYLKPEEYYFIHLDISDKTAIKRALGRARSNEDSLKVIQVRLNVFRKEILPGINYLKKQKSFFEINGEKSKKMIFEELIKKIK